MESSTDFKGRPKETIVHLAEETNILLITVMLEIPLKYYLVDTHKMNKFILRCGYHWVTWNMQGTVLKATVDEVLRRLSRT